MNESYVRHEWIWWLYMALLVAAGYGRMIERVAKDSGGFWSQCGPPIGATIVCIAIFAWLKNKAVAHVWLWRALQFCIGLAQSAAIVFAAYLAANSNYTPAIQLLAISLMLVPALYVLQICSYRSPDIWSRSG